MNEPMQNLLKLQTLEFAAKQGENTKATIEELRSKIPPQILGHYDRLRARGKKGLAAVVNQVCTGCHMRLPLAVIMVLKHEQDIQLCDTCGRYLCLPDESAITEATKPDAAEAARPPSRGKKTRAKRVPA
jgi:predicted  nucleic acid-binding Zn-ribbon protein